jgi:hypothetical protein
MPELPTIVNDILVFEGRVQRMENPINGVLTIPELGGPKLKQN